MSYFERHEKQQRASKYILLGVLGAALLGSYLLISGCPTKAEAGQVETPTSKLGLERIIHDENPIKQI